MMEREWINTQYKLKVANKNRAYMIIQLLLITYQLQLTTLIAGNAPGKSMNWKRTWKYIKKQTILARQNTDILKPYWLKNRFGKIGKDTDCLTSQMNTN